LTHFRITRISRGPAPRGNEASSKAGVNGGEKKEDGVGGEEKIEVDVETVMAQITVQGDKVSLPSFARGAPLIRAREAASLCGCSWKRRELARFKCPCVVLR